MSKGRISERLRKRLNEGTMASPSSPIETGRLDEWTETAIREVLNAGLRHGPGDKLRPVTDCPLCAAIDALRSRIRHLVSEARKEAIVEYLSDKTFTIGESQSFTDV